MYARRSSIVLLTLLVAFAKSGAASAVAAQGTQKIDVTGVVVDRATGAPIVGAAVSVNDGNTLVTDRDGRFRARGVRAGTVRFDVSQLGYADLADTREIRADAQAIRLELQPNPVMLQAIEVIGDRLRARRNSIPYSVRAFDVAQLATSGHWDAFDFIRSRMIATACRPDVHGSWCIRRRGQWVRPQVYVDDARFFGGLDVLEGWPVDDLYLVEVIANGAQVRIYTKRFAQLLASGRTRLSPVMVW
jgi:hypothetical protein